MMCAGLWVACLAFCLMFSPFKTSLQKRKTFVTHAGIAGFVAVVAPIIMVTLIMVIDGMRPAHVLNTYLMAILTSVAFMAIVYFLNTLLDSIGSVHSIDGQGMNTFAEGLDGNDLYERYFEEILLLSKSKNIDVIAHMDFIKRYAFNKCGLCDIRKNEEMLREIFKSIVSNGKGIEINTSGLRSACNEALPGIDMLKLYKECGGEIITCGSDAHFTKDVGFHIKESYQLLKDLGYKYTYTFKNRQAIGEKL